MQQRCFVLMARGTSSGTTAHRPHVPIIVIRTSPGLTVYRFNSRYFAWEMNLSSSQRNSFATALSRKEGLTWVLRYRVTKPDGNRVEGLARRPRRSTSLCASACVGWSQTRPTTSGVPSTRLPSGFVTRYRSTQVRPSFLSTCFKLPRWYAINGLLCGDCRHSFYPGWHSASAASRFQCRAHGPEARITDIATPFAGRSREDG